MVERFRRWKRTCLVVLLVALFLCVVLCAAAAFLAGRANAQGAEPLPLDVLLLIDHSNSMWDKGGVGSDPDLLRVQAANLFISYLGLDTARPENRLGVINFGGESALVVPLRPLNSGERRRDIRAAIADPQRMDWTDPLEALQLAHETLFPQRQRDPARQPVVILLTDGKPELSPAPSPEERVAYVADLRALVDRFRERGCPIFTVALSNEATDADPEIQTVYRNLWQEIAARTPPAEYHEARTADDLLHIYHGVVASLAGAEPDAPVIETLVEGSQVETVTVESGLAQVTLVVLSSDPALEVRLLRPGGAPARPDDPDVRHIGEPGITREEDDLEIWAISNPRAGRWTLELQGHGTVLVWRDAIPQAHVRSPAYAIEVTPLPMYVPAGRSLDVSVSVRETSAEEPAGEPGLRTGLQIVAELRRAGFAEAASLARDDGQGCDAEADDGHYCLSLPDPPPGACTLRLHALLDGEEIARHEVAFEVIPLIPPESPVSPSLDGHVPGASPVASPGRSGPGWILPLVGLTSLAALGGVGGLLIRQRRGRATLEGGLRVLTAPSSLPSWGRAGEGVTGMVLDLPAVPSVVLGGTGKGSLPLPQPSATHSTPVPRVTLRAYRTPEGDIETWIAPLAGEDAGPIALNDRPLETARRLCDGDVLTFGDYRLRYESLRQAGARRARHRPRRWASSKKDSSPRA